MNMFTAAFCLLSVSQQALHRICPCSLTNLRPISSTIETLCECRSILKICSNQVNLTTPNEARGQPPHERGRSNQAQCITRPYTAFHLTRILDRPGCDPRKPLDAVSLGTSQGYEVHDWPQPCNYENHHGHSDRVDSVRSRWNRHPSQFPNPGRDFEQPRLDDWTLH
jgi:hypothetical protein